MRAALRGASRRPGPPSSAHGARRARRAAPRRGDRGGCASAASIVAASGRACGTRRADCYNVSMHDRTLGRAAFLGLVGAGVAGLFVGRDALGLLGKVVPNGVESIVPTAGWRIYTIGSSIPKLDPQAYRLTIGGTVERPVTYTLADLRDLPRAEQVSDFHCVTGWRVENVHWGGVRLRDVLAEAGLRPGAKTLRFVSAE